MKSSFIIVTLFLACSQVNAQKTDQIIQKGNDWYRQQQYDKADATYKEALDKEQGNVTATFNRANALYRQAKPGEAIKLLDELVINTNEPELKAKAYYNKGAILSGQQKPEESIEAYKNALRQDPGDKEARENLQKALLELKKKTPPPPPKEDKKKQQQQQKKQQQQPKMNQKEAQQRLKLLQQKEKEVQQRLQNEKSKTGAGQSKDW